MHVSLRLLVIIGVLLCLSWVDVLAEQPSVSDIIEYRVPPPPATGTRQLDVGMEMAAPIGWPRVLKAKDGRMMMIGGGKVCYSNDRGMRWTTPEDLPVAIRYAIRLNSGNLGGPGPGDAFYHSSDDGKTWEKAGQIYTSNVPALPYNCTMMQSRIGRIFLPVRFISGGGHDGLYHRTMSWGTLDGKLTAVEGHAHFPEPDIGFVYYSDDDGKTWEKSEGGIMIWHKDGYGGMWPCDEPSIVEANKGDVVMYFRTTLGRIYTAQSGPSDFVGTNGQRYTHTPGQRFDFPKPTPLASSYSPCAIRRIERTGDLLIVWNQISGDELRGGYRRGRLSAAISSDDGQSWNHFRCIDTSVLPPLGRVEPDADPQMGRGFDYVGVLPEDYGGVSYPTLDVVDDTVFLFWYKTIVNPREGDVMGRRMRVLPLSWFYEDEPPLATGPKLILKVPANDS